MVPNEDEPPRNIRWELAQLERIRPVRTETLKYIVDEAGRALISFDVETDTLLDSPEQVLLDIEPIIFRYSAPSVVGRFAPTVLSNREDFPRDLPHLFPTPPDHPASPCLARAGLQAIYNVSGVGGVVTRLLNWLNDAKAETLYEDGWDPVPHLAGKARVRGYIDIEALQRHAFARPKGGFGFISAMIRHGSEDSVFVQAATPIIDTSDGEKVKAAKQQMQQSGDPSMLFQTTIPAVFVWPPRDQIELTPHFTTWRDMASLKDGLRKTGLYERFDEAFAYVDFYFSQHLEGGVRADADMRGRHAMLVIVGLWRPVPLDRTIVGLANEDGPRSLELRAFYLTRSMNDTKRWSDQTKLFDFFGLVSNSPPVLEAVSGEPALRRLALLGAGALGSAFADYALRGGTAQLTVVDKDFFLPHNIARHRGDSSNTYQMKTDIVEHLAGLRVQGARVTKYNEEIIALDDKALLERLRDVDQVIDATADPLVRRRLSLLKGTHLPVMRSEIFHQGRLGVSLLTHLGEAQNLNCLFYQLLALAMENETVREWLAYESSRTYEDEELLLGFGCRSLTTKLPAYKVDIHASNAFTLAKAKLQSLDRPLIALHPLDTEGISLGTKIIAPEPVQVFRGETTNGWRVIVTSSVMAKLHQLRASAAPNETGGYLFGALDEVASEIYVVTASPEPRGTVASPVHLQLGRWGRTGFERTFRRRARNRLPPIGTWHSHPSSSAEASQTDWETVAGFKDEDARRGLPTVMAITSLTGDAFYVEG